MNWGVWILTGAIILSIVAVVYFLTFEGFMTQAEADARMGLSSDKFCAKQSSCGTCLSDSAHPGVECGWCPAAQACIPRSGMYRLIPAWLTEIINLDPTKDCPPNPPNSQSNFVWNAGGCSDSCGTFKNCKDCAGALACGWSTGSSTCMSKAAAASGSGGSAGSGPISLVTESGSCPPPVCSSLTDCGSCTSTTGCAYCNDTKKCISVDGNNVPLGGSSGSTGCSGTGLFTQLFQCPCSSLTACSDCAQRPGCAYCTTSSQCINLEKASGAGGAFLPIPQDQLACSADKMATSLSQCAPGAVLGNRRPENSDYRPGANELNMAQNNSALAGNELNVAGSYSGPIGAGNGPVSAAASGLALPFGNGMVVTNPSAAPGLTNAADLASPLESYVKLLVRSELASEGIPMNEPFQVNEAQAVGNAETYLDQSAKRILKK